MRAARLRALGQLDIDTSDPREGPHRDPLDDPANDAPQAAAAFGLVIEGPVPIAARSVFWLWPECLPVWFAWCAVQTQWRHTGMDAVATGLDYAGVTAYLQAHGFGPGRRRSLREALGHIAAMEHEALTVWNEQRAKKANTAHG